MFLGLFAYICDWESENERTNEPRKKCKTAKFLKQVHNVATMQIQPTQFYT